MYRFLLSLVLLFGMSVATVACPCSGDDKPCVCADDCKCEVTNAQGDLTYGVKCAKERITKLPQDANKFYLTVIGNPSDAKFKQIVGWFDTNPELKAFKAQVHFRAMESTSEMYVKQYKHTVPNLPCVRVQTANAQDNPLFQASGKNIPMSAEALTKALNTECLRNWRQKHCKPTPNPKPDTTPAPIDTPDNATPDDTTPDTDTPVDAPSFPWLVLLLSIGGGLLVGGGIGLVKQWRDTYAKA